MALQESHGGWRAGTTATLRSPDAQVSFSDPVDLAVAVCVQVVLAGCRQECLYRFLWPGKRLPYGTSCGSAVLARRCSYFFACTPVCLSNCEQPVPVPVPACVPACLSANISAVGRQHSVQVMWYPIHCICLRVAAAELWASCSPSACNASCMLGSDSICSALLQACLYGRSFCASA